MNCFIRPISLQIYSVECSPLTGLSKRTQGENKSWDPALLQVVYLDHDGEVRCIAPARAGSWGRQKPPPVLGAHFLQGSGRPGHTGSTSGRSDSEIDGHQAEIEVRSLSEGCTCRTHVGNRLPPAAMQKEQKPKKRTKEQDQLLPPAMSLQRPLLTSLAPCLLQGR